MAPFELDIPPHVAEVLRYLPPDIKRPVKAALRAIGADPSIGARLDRELKGLWRFRVRRFRIVHDIDRSRRTARVMAVAHRRHIYDDLAQMARRTSTTPTRTPGSRRWTPRIADCGLRIADWIFRLLNPQSSSQSAIRNPQSRWSAAQAGNERQQILRQRRLEAHLAFVAGMAERQPERV